MKLKELKEKISSLDGDLEVRIYVLDIKEGEPSSVPIDRLEYGFDGGTHIDLIPTKYIVRLESLDTRGVEAPKPKRECGF